jgi:hypothetical protein
MVVKIGWVPRVTGARDKVPPRIWSGGRGRVCFFGDPGHRCSAPALELSIPRIIGSDSVKRDPFDARVVQTASYPVSVMTDGPYGPYATQPNRNREQKVKSRHFSLNVRSKCS